MLIVRGGEETDLDQLTALYNYYVTRTHVTFDVEPFTVAERRRDWFRHYQNEGPHRLLVAADGTRVLGYATSSPFHPKAAYATTVETSVYCDAAAVGRGIGSLLYEHLFDALEGEDVHRAIAGSPSRTTAPSRPSPVRFHRDRRRTRSRPQVRPVLGCPAPRESTALT